MKRIFLINPAAGSASSVLIDALDGVKEVASSRDDLIRRTASALKKGYGQIVAVGGDGTVNAVANGFFPDGSASSLVDACLAVIPAGTGSDYFRSLRGSTSKTWKEILLHPRRVRADVGWLRVSGHAGGSGSAGSNTECCFVNLASMGASAEVVARKARLPKWIPRQLRYAVPTVQQAKDLASFEAEVRIDGEVITGRFLNVFVAKGTWAGGGMRFGAENPLSDGAFEVTLVEAMGAARFMKNLPHLFLGTLHKADGIRRIRARHVRVTPERPIPLEADGEWMGIGAVEFELLKKRLNVCAAEHTSGKASAKAAKKS